MRYIGFMKTIKQLERPSLREQIYESLKTAIVTLELAPGERIRDKDLAEKFGVSRTPVREAIRRLEDEGLVESAPGSLTRVTEINVKEVKDAFTVVAVLHGLAARLAVPKLTERDFENLSRVNQKLETALEKQDTAQAVEEDDHFHNIFLERSGNKEIYMALERVTPKIRRLEFAKFGSIEGIKSVEQHREIISESQSKEVQKVSNLVEENWLSLGKLLTGDIDF